MRVFNCRLEFRSFDTIIWISWGVMAIGYWLKQSVGVEHVKMQRMVSGPLIYYNNTGILYINIYIYICI